MNCPKKLKGDEHSAIDDKKNVVEVTPRFHP
jgi:hypothetical protein